MRLTNRAHFGLPPTLWGPSMHITGDVQRLRALAAAVVSHQLLATIVGPRGAGKTRGVRYVLHAHDVRLVEPLRLARDKLHIGDIEQAIVRDLSDETPRRTGEARSHQVRRILGTASRERAVVLLIDDAHVLHHATVRAIKRLRELQFGQRSPLLGVLLVGQQDCTRRIAEIALRADGLEMAGLSETDAAAALLALNAGAGRRVFDDEFIRAAGQRPEARNWLDLAGLVDTALARARAGAADVVGAAHLDGAAAEQRDPAPASHEQGRAYLQRRSAA